MKYTVTLASHVREDEREGECLPTQSGPLSEREKNGMVRISWVKRTY